MSKEDTKVHIDAANTANYLTKAECRVRLEQLAYSLRTHYGIGASGPFKDVVVGFSSLQILLPISFYGVIAAGGVFSCASHSFTAAELARQIQQGGANLVVCSTDLKDIAIEAAKLCNIGMDRVLVLDSTYQKWSCRAVQGGADMFGEQRLTWDRITDPQVLENSLINLLYSSGTTGAPKGEQSPAPAIVDVTDVHPRRPPVPPDDGSLHLHDIASSSRMGVSAHPVWRA